MKNAAKALIRDSQGRILVLYRSESHPTLAHDIDLPGGEIDFGEAIEDGLIREIAEETGLSIDIQPSNLRYHWRRRFGRRKYLYEVSGASQVEIDISWEHKSYTWMDERELITQKANDDFMHKVQEWLTLKSLGETRDSNI